MYRYITGILTKDTMAFRATFVAHYDGHHDIDDPQWEAVVPLWRPPNLGDLVHLTKAFTETGLKPPFVTLRVVGGC